MRQLVAPAAEFPLFGAMRKVSLHMNTNHYGHSTPRVTKRRDPNALGPGLLALAIGFAVAFAAALVWFHTHHI